MVAIRDLKCSMDIAEMAVLGKFEEEFIIYGCTYMEQDTLYYKVSNRVDDIYRFVEQCPNVNLYPSPVQRLLNRTLVPSGKQDEYLLRSKILLTKQMQNHYGGDNLLASFTALANIPGNDSAQSLLLQIKKQLNGVFDRPLLQLVEGILEYAYCRKKLSQGTYREFQQWLQYVYQQMEDDVVIKKNFQRTFYGFAYWTDQQKIRYYINAQKSDVMQQRERLMSKGTLGSPIVQKTYYFDYQLNLAQVKETFLEQMKVWMDEEYWDVLHAIDALPAAIDAEALQALIAQAEADERKKLVNYMKYYQCLWLGK